MCKPSGLLQADRCQVLNTAKVSLSWILTVNKKMLKREEGKHVRIWPVPLRSTATGYKKMSYFWFVEKVKREAVEISCPSTGHVKDIGLDHVNYMTDSKFGSEGILQLDIQIIIHGFSVDFEPITPPSGRS